VKRGYKNGRETGEGGELKPGRRIERRGGKGALTEAGDEFKFGEEDGEGREGDRSGG